MSFLSESSVDQRATAIADYSDLDPLAVYDKPSIGNEFVSDTRLALSTSMRVRQAQTRATQVAMAQWKETASLSDSQRIPKEKLKASRRYEVDRVFADSLIKGAIFVSGATLAGVLLAIVFQAL